MFIQQLLLLIAQVLALVAIVGLGALGARTVFVRLFNPGTWFVLFCVLWLILPQVASMANDNLLVGYTKIPDSSWVATQVYLLAFFLCVLVGVLAVRGLFLVSNRQAISYPYRKSLSRLDFQILVAFYVAGAAATLYLGRTLMMSDGFRSALVKTSSGQLLTVMMFFGAFAMSVLLGRGIFERRYLQAFLSVGILGSLIFFTGARGRLLWPVAIALVYTFCRGDKVQWKRMFAFATIGVTALLFFDPILIALREGLQHWSTDQVFEKIDLADLYVRKRNFDGFSNFALITSEDSVPYDPRILWTGARYTFMTHYFPGTLESGVGFGATIPGMFWLSGGLPALIGGGLGYGVLLGALDFAVRRVRSEPLFWSYCFAMTWLCAVGGNFQESLDKMLAVAAPGILWWLLSPRGPANWQDEDGYDEDDALDSDDQPVSDPTLDAGLHDHIVGERPLPAALESAQ